MSCIPCTKVTQTEQDVIRYYKHIYKTKGIEYYVYRLHAKDGIKVVKKSYFNILFETQIKPNLKHGAEYFSISEFTGN